MRPNRSGTAFASVVAALLFALGAQAILPAKPAAAAQPEAPPGPDRIATITVDYTAYTWWMATWDNNTVECSLVIDHEGQPTLDDVYQNCDANVASDFAEQPPCYGAARKQRCEGDYLYLVDTQPSQREITVTLPAPQVSISLEGCDPVSRAGTSICESAPVLVLQGEEPLPNEHILGIEGTVDSTPFKCDATCKLELSPTDGDGANVQFWAWSSYGDSSQVFGAQVRVALDDVNNPDQSSYYVDVLSS